MTHRALDQQAPGQIFTGLHFHTFVPAKNQLDKIKERGGIIDKTLQGTKTTHVIVRFVGSSSLKINNLPFIDLLHLLLCLCAFRSELISYLEQDAGSIR